MQRDDHEPTTRNSMFVIMILMDLLGEGVYLKGGEKGRGENV